MNSKIEFKSSNGRDTFCVEAKKGTGTRHSIVLTHDYVGRGDGPLKGFDLAADERDALVAFLKSVPMQ